MYIKNNELNPFVSKYFLDDKIRFPRLVQELLDYQPKPKNNYKINLAGTEKEDIKLEILGRELQVKVKNKLHTYIILDENQSSSKITSKYNNGLLEIDIGEKEKKSRAIQIE